MVRRQLEGVLAGGNGTIKLRLDGGSAYLWLRVVYSGGMAIAAMVWHWILNFVIFVFLFIFSLFHMFGLFQNLQMFVVFLSVLLSFLHR